MDGTRKFLDSGRPGTRRFVGLGATLWCSAILAAPLLDLQSVYAFFSTICHQDPARSWMIAGAPLAVCIRCSSIYYGFLTALLVRLPERRRFLAFAVLATAVEFALARVGLDYAASRSISGLALGLSAAPFVERGISELLYRRGTRTCVRT